MKLFLLLFALIVLASSAQSETTIDTQIEQVMRANSSERYELMNQLKTKLATMNENERNEALQKLSGGKNPNRNGNGSGLMLQIHKPSMQNQLMNPNNQGQQQINPNNSQNKR